MVVTMAVAPTASAGLRASIDRPNVVILMSDDQRWDKVTRRYTPNIWTQLVQEASTAHPAIRSVVFENGFVSNPTCCPARTTVLTGNYSHTTGVWDNVPPFGGFASFDDEHTIAVDFRDAGYRTALVGKYLNGYVAGRQSYIPPGWDRWFAARTGSFYDYGITSDRGLIHFGSASEDYSTRVFERRAELFVRHAIAGGVPFFLYYAFTAPHGPAIPDVRDIGRFAGEPDYTFDQPDSSMLDAGYGVDRAVGQLLDVLPDNTIVLYMSDNGYMWGDNSVRGRLSGKLWPYNESIRVPMIYASLDGRDMPNARHGDIVANLDLRTSLLHAAGLAPLTSQEGINWFRARYVPRRHLLIEHFADPTYCGIRTKRFMYARFHELDGSYSEELYDEIADPLEMNNLASDPAHDTQRLDFLAQAQAECAPPPPDYSW